MCENGPPSGEGDTMIYPQMLYDIIYALTARDGR